MKVKFHCPIVLILVVGILFSCKKEQITSPEAISYNFNQKATNFLAQNQWDSAYYYYNKSKNEAVDKKSDQYAYTLLQIATLQQSFGDFSGCEETITDALANYSGSTYLPYFYNMLAIAYDKQKDYENAVEYYNKAFKITKDSLSKAIITNNIGLAYLQNKEYKKALSILEPLTTHPKIIENELEYARVLDNVGYAQFLLKNPLGINNISKSLEIRERLQEPVGLLTTYMHLSEYYQMINPTLAEEYALQAFETSKKVSSPDDQLEAMKWLTENSPTPFVKEYAKNYFKLNDSLTTVRTNAKNQFAKIKFDAKKATQEVIKYKNRNGLLIGLMAFLLLAVLLLYFLYQSINKRKLLQEAYVTETRISKRIHDELANDVFNAMTFTQTKDLENSNNKERLLDSLETIYNKSRDISKENSNIRTDEHFNDDLTQMINSFSNTQTVVISKSMEEVVWMKLSHEKKIGIFKVLQELLINTKKHSGANLVVIDFQNQPRSLQINYSDNGVGFENTSQKKSGLHNAENRILAMKGTLTFDSQINKGFRAKLIIPK